MAAAATRQLRERVTFDFNAPIEVTLDGAGIEQEGRDGPEFRYFLEGDRIMWVPPEAHIQILRAIADDPQAQAFTITRHKSGRGAASWEVVQHSDEPANWTPPDRDPAPPRTTSQAKPGALPPQMQQPAPRQQQPAPTAANGPMSDTLYTCMCAAIRTAQAAEKFAQEIGRPVALDSADIRAMAATLYIHATGGR
jgi:hypothetical protein